MALGNKVAPPWATQAVVPGIELEAAGWDDAPARGRLVAGRHNRLHGTGFEVGEYAGDRVARVECRDRNGTARHTRNRVKRGHGVCVVGAPARHLNVKDDAAGRINRGVLLVGGLDTRGAPAFAERSVSVRPADARHLFPIGLREGGRQGLAHLGHDRLGMSINDGTP